MGAPRADALIIDSLGHTWSAVGITAAGTTCAVDSGPPTSGHEKVHLTQLGWSIRNAGAAAYTATLNVRDASIGGTVLATWDMLVGTGASLQDSWAVNLMSTKGNRIAVDFGTPASSVTQRVSIAGWRNQSTDG